ncbi:MAG: hypothetical protein QXX12_03385 [Nanopusillaceae archaeon]
MIKEGFYKIFPFVFLIFLLNSCASSVNSNIKDCNIKHGEVPVMVKCKIPHVPKSSLYDLSKYQEPDVKLQKLIENYYMLLKENKMLRSAIDLCNKDDSDDGK